MHKLEVTEAELKYRAIIHDELRAQKQRELSCTSCGNVLSHKSQEIFSHPILEILQCRKCNKSSRDFLKSEDFSACQICTTASKNCYKCSRKNCRCKVCRACLRRNAVNSLAEAESAQWKCFVCNSKPLWKLRGVCAAVMSLTSKRTKKKQVSGNSDTDNEKTDFKNISYVKSRRINDLIKLRKRLAEICDEESSSESVELSRPQCDLKNEATNREQLNVHKKPEQYSGYGNILGTNTSSDDCDVLEIKSISHKRPSKSQNRRESPEKRKNKSISQTDSRSWRKESRLGVLTSPRKMVTPVTYASSDDSDFEESKKIMTTTKRNSKDEPSGKRRKISEATANGCKSGKSKEGIKRKTISFETSEQDEEEDENSMELKNPVKNVRRTSRQSSSTKATGGETKLRKLNNEKEKVERKSNKSQYHRRLMKNDSVPSDSSSGQEFHKSKLFPSSYVALKRIDELEKDYTKTPEASPGTPKDTLTKDQTFALQNSVTDFFKNLKKAANQLVNDIEVVERKYCMKNSMRPTDVNDLILKTKNVVTNYKQCVDTGENKIEDYYDKWCKKANIKNVLRVKKTSKEVDRPLPSKEESPKKCSRSRNDSSDESSPVREKSRSSSPVTRTQSTNFDVISDCNSEEIFSGDEIRNSSKKSNPPSPSEGNGGAISRESSVEKAPIIADVSSDENLESSTPKKLSKKSLNKSSSSIDYSDHSIDMEDKKKASKLNGNLEMLNSSKTSARSIDLSDCDIFEDDDDDADKEKTEEKKGNQSIGEISDIEEQSTPVKASNSEKSPTKIDSPRSSNDSQRSAKSTIPPKSPKIQQDSNKVIEEREEISTKDHDASEKDAEDDQHSDNESICSRETLRGNSSDKLETDPKSPAVNDDIEAVESTSRIGEDTEDILERTSLASPSDILGVETPTSRHENNDEKFENVDLKSPSKNTTETESRKPVSEKKKSRSSSPINETSKKPSSEKEMREKCIEENNGEEESKSNSPQVNNSRKRSSEGSDENDTTEIDKPLKSRSNSLRFSTSSTPSEDDDLEARNKLLLSSNSEESSGAEDSLVLRHSGNLENEDDPETLPESDSNISQTVDKDKSDVQPETTEKKQPLKTKRTKFRMENHPHFMQDAHLRQGCAVSLKRLEQKVLDRYSKALEKSRDYVDSKKLKRLVDLDNLDKKKAASKSSNSEDDDTPHKDLKNKKKTKAAKEREETLLDHLEKVKNGKNLDLSIEYGSDASDTEQDNKNKPGDLSEDNNLFAEAEKMAKKRLLESSDSEKEEPSVGKSSDQKDEGNETTKKTKGAVQKEKSDRLSNDDEKRQEKADKSRWRKNKLLTLRISDSDSNDEKKKSELAEEKSASKAKKGGSESDESEEEKYPKKKRIRRRVLHSDSDGEPSPPSESESSDESDEDPKKKKSGSDDEAKKKRKRKKKGDSDSSSSDSLEEKRPKTRRKRIKTADSESDSDLENSQGSPSKTGRKNIRKLIRDKQVADVTKQAAKDEEERLQRIAERQKLYNQMYENRLASETKVDKLVLDFNEETKETLVSVDEELVKKLKPHQAQGIKFMWDACFESLERIKTTKGSGCILAHCMGLGKSFQVVALSHTLLQHEETGIKTIMVVCPLSTVLNWANEFKIWLENVPDGDDIEVYELTKLKQNSERKFQLQRWQKTGGVMIIGYEMFRNLSNTGKKVRKNMQDAFLHCLVDPGPDLIVCDEGHLLKNEDTALSKAMRRVKTLRRIVLTGTPLQNNLIEYHCMVQFVKPNLLGTKKEFTNRFENPITNGQFDDSTEYDVRLMKKRAHVLHKMLEGSVQRLDYSVLTPFLPPKQEYVIFVKLTEVQVKMYRHYLDNYARRAGGVGGSLFADFQALQRIWTHPLVVRLSQRQKNLANEKKRMDSDSEGSLRDFINDGSDSDTSSSGSDIQSVSNSDEEVDKTRKRGTRANPVMEEEPVAVNLEKNEEPHSDEWWEQFIKEGDCEDMRVSCKLLILFAILKQSHMIGDKVLVFSQSLYSLTLIEEFLRMIDDATQAGHDDLENLDKHSGSWSLGLDYFRLDGQTSADNRRRWCDIFNRPSNTRARLFLISTRAGGLGINLTAANRVIIFDASWNPSHDVQSIFRIYRFGQKKPCYVYRLLAAGTMEEKIYNRQVTKLSLSCRVVDEQQIERHYSNNALAELYELEVSEDEKTLNLPKDRLLADILLQYKHCVFNYHEHDSLLENQAGEELDEEERQQAWLEYEEEKKGRRILPPTPFVNYQNELFMQQTNLILAQQNAALTNPAMMLDYENIRKMMSKDYPGVSEAQQKAMATRTVYEMYNYVERQAMANQLPRVNQVPLASQLPLANQMPLAMINMGTGALHFDNRQAQQPAPVAAHPTPEMIRMYQQSLIQQNGQINFPKNKNINAVDSSAHTQNSSLPLMPQLPSQSTTLPAVVDDDIIEIPASPEKILGTPPVPGGSRKSQEE